MKYAGFNIGRNKIEVENSILGMETILVNNKICSRKPSITGTTHNFKIGNDEFNLITKYKLFSSRMINLTLEKDGDIIEEKSIPTDPEQRIYWMGMGLIVGLIISWLFK